MLGDLKPSSEHEKVRFLFFLETGLLEKRSVFAYVVPQEIGELEMFLYILGGSGLELH